MLSSPDRAPRLRAYLQHAEGRSVLTMPREDWDRFRVTRGAMIPVDVTKTPMERVAQKATSSQTSVGVRQWPPRIKTSPRCR